MVHLLVVHFHLSLHCTRMCVRLLHEQCTLGSLRVVQLLCIHLPLPQVISRIFYTVGHSWHCRITLHELRKSKLLEVRTYTLHPQYQPHCTVYSTCNMYMCTYMYVADVHVL